MRRARGLRVAITVTLTACASHRAMRLPDPASARRFEIVSTSDTIFRFVVRDAPWIRRGSIGIAVDPARHDALIARYIVREVRGDTVVALVTGQTTDVSREHVALLTTPRQGILRQTAFWVGLAGGGAVATAAFVAGR